MKKRKFKNFFTAMVIGLLFTTTVAYGADGDVPFNFTVHASQSVYTGTVTKTTTTMYARVRMTTLYSIMEYQE